METNNMITEQNYKSDTSEDEILDAIVELEEYFEEISGALHGLCWNFSHNQEKEAAQKLYSLFIDFIAEYNQADYDVWCCDFDKTGDWPKYVSKYPDRKPMIIAIQKSKLYLPSEIIKGSEELLADMTGTYEYIWEEVNSFDTHGSCKSYRYWLYTLWLKEKGIDAEYTEEVERNKHWYAFLKDLHGGYWYRRLDKMFARYINNEVV